MVVPPNHPLNMGFSKKTNIHFGVFPQFLETPKWMNLNKLDE